MSLLDPTASRPPLRGRSGFVDAGGVSIHYLEYGDAGHDLLLVPGLSSPAATYETVSVALAERFRVVCVDLRGRGLSAKPRDGYALPDYAGDLRAVIDACGLRRPILLGHALGARIVPAFDVLHPGTAGLLVIVDPPATGPGWPPYATPIESFQRQLADAYARPITAEDVRRHFPNWDDESTELRAAWLDTCDANAVEQSYRNFQLEDFFGYVAEARTPGMFLYGETTHAVSPEAIAAIAASNDRLRIVTLPATGHMLPFENLAGFLEVTTAFVDDALRNGLLRTE